MNGGILHMEFSFHRLLFFPGSLAAEPRRTQSGRAVASEIGVGTFR